MADPAADPFGVFDTDKKDEEKKKEEEELEKVRSRGCRKEACQHEGGVSTLSVANTAS